MEHKPYTQRELEEALGWLESQFYRAGLRAREGNWEVYSRIMRDIDDRYCELRRRVWRV